VSRDPAGRGHRSNRIRAAIASALPGERFGDQLAILSGTGQNVLGLAVFVLATIGTNILISRAFGKAHGAEALGLITLATQLAFIGGAATRFGMDMAAVRRVAVDVGKGEPGRARAVMNRAAAIAAVASAVLALVILFAAGPLSHAFGESGSKTALEFAALALPFVALSQVYLGGTRGLKIMRHTLLIYWAGQPLAWILLMAVGWVASKTVGMSVLAYAVSWILATLAAFVVWRKETAKFSPALPAEPGEVRELIRYGAPRAPASLLAQLLFWTDYFVLARYVPTGELGVYAAAIRLGQALVLFLVAVNYMFSPFVADLYARGERDKLNGLYQALTWWMVAGTIPLVLLLAVAPGPALQLFGAHFETGSTPLRILLIGQLVNVATGSVGFILVMVGRTVWDLAVYSVSFALDLGAAFLLAPHLGARGAAVAQMIALVVSNGLGLYLVWRFVRIQPFNRYYVRLALPAAGSALVMILVHLGLRQGGWAPDLVATGVGGGLAYTALLLTIGLAPAERRALARITGRTPAA
jgi:O-antigen/teichoic acid export membrane protein